MIGRSLCLNMRLEDQTWKWHARLGHISFRTLKTMSQNKMVRGLPQINDEAKICESCLVGKQTRQGFPKATTFRASKPLELLHADLCGPITPQQNGVVERRNMTLMEMTRSSLKAMQVPNYLWVEFVRHSTYLINRIPTKALKDITPYESLRKRKPNIDHLRVFGCKAYAKVDSATLKKLDDRSQTLVHLGIESVSKAYRLFNPTTKRVIVSRDVVFDEKANWNWK